MFRIGDALSHLGWRPPVRTTALLQLEAGVQGDPSAWERETGRIPASLRETLRRHPSTVQERWFGRMWLLKPAMIACLSLFWILSGLIGVRELEAATAVLTDRGVDAAFSRLAVVMGSAIDLILGYLILVRSTHKFAAVGMILTTLGYLAGGTLLTPDLWADPLGPFVKTLPGAMLALVALAVAEER
jgi:hypothetical protein